MTSSSCIHDNSWSLSTCIVIIKGLYTPDRFRYRFLSKENLYRIRWFICYKVKTCRTYIEVFWKPMFKQKTLALSQAIMLQWKIRLLCGAVFPHRFFNPIVIYRLGQVPSYFQKLSGFEQCFPSFTTFSLLYNKTKNCWHRIFAKIRC